MADGSEFLCPRCKVPLKEVRTPGGVFYGCDACSGRAVTIELLRKRFTPESVSLDSIACLIRFRSLEFVPNYRNARAESRNEFGLIRPSGRRGSRRPWLARLAKPEGKISIARLMNE